MNANRETRARVAERNRGAESPRKCPDCQHMWLVSEDGPACDCCGWIPTVSAKAVQVQAADLVEIGGDGAGEAGGAEKVDEFYAEALTFYANRWPDRWASKENSGRYWAWVQCRKKFAIKAARPPSQYWRTPRAPVSVTTNGWLRAQLIAYAKARA